MATTISKLEVELTLDSTKFEARVRGSKAALAAFTTQIGKSDAKVKRHAKNVRTLGTSFRHTIVTLGLMRDAIRTAWRASGGLVQGIVDVTAEFERLNILLTGMSKGVTAIEKMTDAADQFNKVIDLAKNAPFAVKELTNSWVKFKSVGVDPATGSLNALVDAVSAFGGTGDILHRATIAVQQMAGKGVISMEELRQQMGEAVPQAMVLLARGMNMSVGNMVDAISKGSVVAKPALQKLFAEFDLTFGGASQKLMETYIGSLARLSTVWQLTLKEMGEASGLFEAVKEEVKLLIVQLDDPAIRRFGIDIAIGMVKGFRLLVNAIRESVKWLSEHADTVWKVIAAWGAFKAMQIVNGLLMTNTAVLALTFNLRNLALLGFGKLTGSVFMAGRAFVALRNSFVAVRVAFLAIPIVGWIAAAAAVAAAIWGWFKASDALNEAQETGIENVTKYGAAASKANMDLARAEQAVGNAAIVRAEILLAQKLDSLRQMEEAGSEAGVRIIQAQVEEQQALISIMKRNMQQIDDDISKATGGAARRAAGNAKRAMLEVFRSGVEEARNFARSADTEIDTLFTSGKIDEAERLRRRLINWEEFQEASAAFAVSKTKEYQDMILEADRVLKKDLSEEDKTYWQTQRLAAIAAIKGITVIAREERIRVENDLAHIMANTELMSGAEKAMAGFESSFNTIIGNSKGKIAALNAEMFDGNTKLASFLAKATSGKIFGNIKEWSDPMKAAFMEIVPLLAEIDKIGDEVKRKKAFESALKMAKKTLAAATEEANIFAEAVDNGLNEVPNNRVRRFRRMMAAVIAQFGEASKEAKVFARIQAELIRVAASTNADEKILKVKKELEDLDVAGIQNARDRFKREQELFDIQWKAFLQENAQAENIDLLTQRYEELREAKAKAFEDSTPMKRLLKDWEDTRGKLEESYANWMDGFVNTIVDGIKEGKIAFHDLAVSILADLARILLKALMVRAVMSVLGGVSTSPTGDITAADLSGIVGSAMGNVVGPDGAMSLKRYARGGIATKPQISVFGEGDMNEAYVPLPDGRSIPVSIRGSGGKETPDVTVNVINESGIPVDAEQDGGLEFDGESYVLDVVLKASGQPGNFRDGLRANTR